MVCGPASRPCPARSFRSGMISPAVPGLIADGEVFGRRDRGPDAASPSARYRASSRDIQPWETPYRRAASPWLSPSTESLGRGLAQGGYRVTPVSAAQYLSSRSWIVGSRAAGCAVRGFW